jgi:DNA-binding NarL/FixJ family response regulator
MNILLADDQPRVRFALRILLEQQPNWKVVGEAATATELLDLVAPAHPDLVLLDGDLPGLDSPAHLRVIRALCPGVCIIALSESLPNATNGRAARADAYASKAHSPDHLLEVIRGCRAAPQRARRETDVRAARH